ncbi:MAG: hypothetical protein ACI9UK_002335 [Candidatus Krumholzibacteriia bacterium]|jgi:hypothetical protein
MFFAGQGGFGVQMPMLPKERIPLTAWSLENMGRDNTSSREKKIMLGAVGVSILLHIVVALATWNLPLNAASDEPYQPTAQDIELVFEAPLESEQSDKPTAYVAVPDRLAAEEAPEDPDYLALNHSAAADNTLGDGDKPAADLESEFESVSIKKEELDGAGGVAYSPQPDPSKKPAQSNQESGTKGEAQATDSGDNQDPLGEMALADQTAQSGEGTSGEGEDAENQENADLEDWWGGRDNPSILKDGDEGSVGDRGFDFNQEARGSVTSGVAVINEFQLNTVQWDWAPWIQVFANELHRHWVSPYAYRLGLINGTTVIKLVVEKDGRPSSMVILDEDGHESLHTASVAALKAFAPYLPLPSHFPEENLVITLSLHYPSFRR